MILKLAILVVVVLCICDLRALAINEFQLVTCQQLKAIKSGYIGYELKDGEMRGVGSIAYLACHAYHDLRGNNVTKCDIDGIWRPKLGVCELKPEYDENFCKPYESDEQPLLKYNPSPKINLGTIITVICQPGQRLLGNAKSKCIGGIWKPTLGKCVDKDKITTIE
uniref:Sushi domain-containing protein n=2 Tax=Wuchereria bancrofti TaxID=6293 RepID=A0AAF5PJH5_WUCBA